MGKAELIERYGIEYYEQFKAKSRERMYRKYHENVELARKRKNDSQKWKNEARKRYVESHREIYRINCRDRNRLKLKGAIPDDMVIHHLKYHADNKYPDWMDDILIMTREEHAEWHRLHPEFVATENIV